MAEAEAEAACWGRIICEYHAGSWVAANNVPGQNLPPIVPFLLQRLPKSNGVIQWSGARQHSTSGVPVEHVPKVGRRRRFVLPAVAVISIVWWPLKQ